MAGMEGDYSNGYGPSAWQHGWQPFVPGAAMVRMVPMVRPMVFPTMMPGPGMMPYGPHMMPYGPGMYPRGHDGPEGYDANFYTSFYRGYGGEHGEEYGDAVGSGGYGADTGHGAGGSGTPRSHSRDTYRGEQHYRHLQQKREQQPLMHEAVGEAECEEAEEDMQEGEAYDEEAEGYEEEGAGEAEAYEEEAGEGDGEEEEGEYAEYGEEETADGRPAASDLAWALNRLVTAAPTAAAGPNTAAGLSLNPLAATFVPPGKAPCAAAPETHSTAVSNPAGPRSMASSKPGVATDATSYTAASYDGSNVGNVAYIVASAQGKEASTADGSPSNSTSSLDSGSALTGESTGSKVNAVQADSLGHGVGLAAGSLATATAGRAAATGQATAGGQTPAPAGQASAAGRAAEVPSSNPAKPTGAAIAAATPAVTAVAQAAARARTAAAAVAQASAPGASGPAATVTPAAGSKMSLRPLAAPFTPGSALGVAAGVLTAAAARPVAAVGGAPSLAATATATTDNASAAPTHPGGNAAAADVSERSAGGEAAESLASGVANAKAGDTSSDSGGARSASAGSAAAERVHSPAIPVPRPLSHETPPERLGALADGSAQEGRTAAEPDTASPHTLAFEALQPMHSFQRFVTGVFRLFQGRRGEYAFASHWWCLLPADAPVGGTGGEDGDWNGATQVYGPYSCEQMILAYIARVMPENVLVCGTRAAGATTGGSADEASAGSAGGADGSSASASATGAVESGAGGSSGPSDVDVGLHPPVPPPQAGFVPLRDLLAAAEQGLAYALR